MNKEFYSANKMIVFLFVWSFFDLTISIDNLISSKSEIVIQQRIHTSFAKKWIDYQRGFSYSPDNFWAGLDYIHQKTDTNTKKIRFEMKKFDDDTMYWSEYEHFHILGPDKKYQLDISHYNKASTAGDGMLSSENTNVGTWDLNEMKFSTMDMDNDNWKEDSCSQKYFNNAGWWFNFCSLVNPNSADSPVWNREKEESLTWFRIVLNDLKNSNEIVIQQRTKIFDRNWNDYQKGFGILNSNYWAGLDYIHNVTKTHAMKIRFEMKKFDDKTMYWSQYEYFKIDGPDNNYQLYISAYNNTSTAGDGMLSNSDIKLKLSGMYFSTKDRDYDRLKTHSCSHVHRNAGWWFNDCSKVNPNSGDFPYWDTPEIGGKLNLRWFSIVLINPL